MTQAFLCPAYQARFNFMVTSHSKESDRILF